MDQIGLDGVERELAELGYPEEAGEALPGTFGDRGARFRRCALPGGDPGRLPAGGTGAELADIMDTVTDVASVEFGLEFDPTLVRGMGYYTGDALRGVMDGFGGSVAGGGRYDRMIGKFTGHGDAGLLAGEIFNVLHTGVSMEENPKLL